MQPILSHVITTLLFILTQRNSVAAQERMVRYLFNNGNAPSSSQTCTSQDNEKIDEIFRYRYNRRYLRSNDSIVDKSAVRNYNLVNETTFPNTTDFAASETASRELQYPRYCKDNCAGYKPGSCRATNCIGYRRELKNENYEHNDRDLPFASCSTVLTAIQGKLDTLIRNNQVSSSCKSFLTAPIIKSCTDNVVYGELERLKVWDVSNPSSPQLMGNFDAKNLPNTKAGMATPPSSFSVCRSKKITFEAAMNPCVMVTTFHMYYNSDWWNPFYVNNEQRSLPYSLYGNTGSQMNGQQWLNVGTYVLDIKPDWWIWKEKRFVFTVMNC